MCAAQMRRTSVTSHAIQSRDFCTEFAEYAQRRVPKSSSKDRTGLYNVHSPFQTSSTCKTGITSIDSVQCHNMHDYRRVCMTNPKCLFLCPWNRQMCWPGIVINLLEICCLLLALPFAACTSGSWTMLCLRLPAGNGP